MVEQRVLLWMLSRTPVTKYRCQISGRICESRSSGELRDGIKSGEDSDGKEKQAHLSVGRSSSRKINHKTHNFELLSYLCLEL